MPGKEVNKMQEAYCYIQAILSTGHVCRKTTLMIYLKDKTECQIHKKQTKKPPKVRENKEKHNFCLNYL